MTKLLKKFWPDEPHEYAYIGSAVGRLGTAMAGVGALQDNLTWTLISLFISWIGFEVNGYFKLHKEEEDKPEP